MAIISEYLAISRVLQGLKTLFFRLLLQILTGLQIFIGLKVFLADFSMPSDQNFLFLDLSDQWIQRCLVFRFYRQLHFRICEVFW